MATLTAGGQPTLSGTAQWCDGGCVRATSGLLSSRAAAHRHTMRRAPLAVYRQIESNSLPLADSSHRCRRSPNLKQSDRGRGRWWLWRGSQCTSVRRPCRTDNARRTVLKNTVFSLVGSDKNVSVLEKHNISERTH